MTRPPEPREPLRVFLDSTVLYAASRGGGSLQLWSAPGVHLVTSEYAARETWNCLAGEENPQECRDRLTDLLSAIEIIPYADASAPLYCSWRLKDPKDVPILVGAIESRCHYLLTADKRHFGEYFGTALDGVTILQPGTFMHQLGL